MKSKYYDYPMTRLKVAVPSSLLNGELLVSVLYENGIRYFYVHQDLSCWRFRSASSLSDFIDSNF